MVRCAALLPGLVSAAIGYVIFIGLGDWQGLATPGLTVPHLPAYHGTHVLDLLIAIAAGILTALLIAAIRRLAVTLGEGRQAAARNAPTAARRRPRGRRDRRGGRPSA